MKCMLSSLSVATALVAPHHDSLLGTKEVLWKGDCFKRVPAYGFLQSGHQNPGAGMHPDNIVPFQTVLKDGFMMVACVKDAMYEAGDKFGNNKFQYKMGDIANSSIVHYTEIVPKEDRTEMTPDVCFEFCRGIPDMGFFGISNGRDCYCTPFYKALASDSSSCDSVCDGDNTRMCGGPSKNSMFEMHMCDTTEDDLKKAQTAADATQHHMDEACGAMIKVAEAVEFASTSMQKTFGSIGDPVASNMMQEAKVHAGSQLHASEDCLDIAKNIGEALGDSAKLKGKDLKKYDNRKAAEDSIADLEKLSAEGTDFLEQRMEEWKKAQPREGSAVKHANTFLPAVLDQYYSLMYFVDKTYKDDAEYPVTCGGDLIGEPALGLDAGHCASACDDQVGKCVGFAAYELDNGGEDAEGGSVMCYLFSKFESAQYYTGCTDDDAQRPSKGPEQRPSKKLFLQHEEKQKRAALAGFVTLHRHNRTHHNHSAKISAQCQKQRSSSACEAAQAATNANGGSCYLTPNNMWKFPDLPNYFSCLQACCEDYDSELMLDGLTCNDIVDFYPDEQAGCEHSLDVSNPPAGTEIKDICPKYCADCPPVAAQLPETTTTPTPPVSTTVFPVVTTVLSRMQPTLPTEIKAMCRAKFSLFGSVSLKPDPEGKNKFALKELTKADRCFDA